MESEIVVTRTRPADDKRMDVRDRILEMLQRGCTRKTAAEASGIAYETLRTWMVQDSAFSASVIEAEAQCVAAMTIVVTDAAIMKKSPTFALEFLKRRDRAAWGDKITVEETAAPAEKPDLSALDDDELATLERLLEKTKGAAE